MRWNFWIELRGPARLWAASIVFTILGALFLFAVPRYLPLDARENGAWLAFPILGWTFFILGLLVLVPMFITLYIRRTQPERERVWHWWINFIGGLLGALAFAVPATLMFPVFLIAYFTRPNALIESDAVAANNLGIAALFSVIGIVVLVAIFFLARIKMKNEDPRQGV